jgi:hypothetical protein
MSLHRKQRDVIRVAGRDAGPPDPAQHPHVHVARLSPATEKGALKSNQRLNGLRTTEDYVVPVVNSIVLAVD